MQWSLFLLGLLFTLPASALYLQETETSYLDIRALARVFAIHNNNPDDTLLYPDPTTSSVAAIARLIGQGTTSGGIDYDFNIYQTAIPQKMATAAGSVISIERSDLLEWSFHDTDYQHLAVDQLFFSWSNESTTIRIGRQPINLATNYYFTPNDLFAPFSAQTFYRTYKAGVDGIRIEHSLGEFSQLSWITVFGYDTETNNDSGWSSNIEQDRNSNILRYTTTSHDLEWNLFAGELTGETIIGGGFQGELTEYIGMRSEIQQYTQPGQSEPDIKAAFGIDRRWDNTIHLRSEIFYNGTGKDQVSQYTAGSSYLATRYLTVGVSYEFTPLFNGDLLLLGNMDDNSSLIALNGLYSLSDECELNFGFSIPSGDKPGLTSIESEYGSSPTSLSIEIRNYF